MIKLKTHFFSSLQPKIMMWVSAFAGGSSPHFPGLSSSSHCHSHYVFASRYAADSHPFFQEQQQSLVVDAITRDLWAGMKPSRNLFTLEIGRNINFSLSCAVVVVVDVDVDVDVDVVVVGKNAALLLGNLSTISILDNNKKYSSLLQVVQEYERAVIFRLGRLLEGGSKGPGKLLILFLIKSERVVVVVVVVIDARLEATIIAMTWPHGLC
jgi:hypothetical protein